MTVRPTGLGGGLLAFGMAALVSACATTQEVETASRKSLEKTEEVRASLESKIEEVTRLQRRAEEQQAALEKLLKDTQGQLSTAQQRNAELETRVQEIKGQDLSSLQGQFETIRRDLDGLQSGLDDQKAQVFSLNQRVTGRLDEQAAQINGVDKTLGKMTETVQAIAGKLSTQVEQQGQSLAKMDETTKQTDSQVKALAADLGKFQVALSEFEKVLRVLNDRAADAAKGKAGAPTAQEGERAAKLEALKKQVEADGQAMKTLTTIAEQQAARLETLEKTLTTMIASQKETSGGLGEPKRAEEEPVGQAAVRADAPPDVPAQPAERTSIPAEPPRPADAAPRTAPAASVLAAKVAYERAQSQYGKGQYDSALTSFKLFLVQYPGSPLVPNAHFWMAECYYRTRDYGRGIEEYEQVVKNYPKSEKAPRALYRKAMAFLELNDKDAAKTTLRKLIDGYPNSEDSKQARTKLASLK